MYKLIGPDSCIPHCLGSSLEFPLKRQSTHTFINIIYSQQMFPDSRQGNKVILIFM